MEVSTLNRYCSCTPICGITYILLKMYLGVKEDISSYLLHSLRLMLGVYGTYYLKKNKKYTFK